LTAFEETYIETKAPSPLPIMTSETDLNDNDSDSDSDKGEDLHLDMKFSETSLPEVQTSVKRRPVNKKVIKKGGVGGGLRGLILSAVTRK
jgi:hypothetical protein